MNLTPAKKLLLQHTRAHLTPTIKSQFSMAFGLRTKNLYSGSMPLQ